MAFSRRCAEAVTLRALLLNWVAAIALLFGASALTVLIFWFVPRIQGIVNERDIAVARALATQTAHYLSQARQTVETLAEAIAESRRGGRNLDLLVRASSSF